MVAVDAFDMVDLPNVNEELFVFDAACAFVDSETDSDVGSILGGENQDIGNGASLASDSGISLVAQNQIVAKTPARSPSTTATPRLEPPGRRVKNRILGTVVRAPAAVADAKKVQRIQQTPPASCLKDHQSRGRQHSKGPQKRRSLGRRDGASVGGIAAGVGQKPALGQMFRHDLDEDMGETSNKASPVGTPREQLRQARPSSIARSYARVKTELHRLDGDSDFESSLPPSRQQRLSLLNRRAKAVSALELDCGIGAESSFAHALRPHASRSSSSPRMHSPKINTIMAADRLQLVHCISGAITDVKRPASLAPMSARPGRSAESQLPAIHRPLSPRRKNLEKQLRLVAVYW